MTTTTDDPAPPPEGSPAPGRFRAAWARVVRAARWLGPRLPGPVGVVLVALAGGVIGAVLAPSTDATVGPLQVQVRVVPSFDPGVRLLLPPAGRVEFDTHRAPWAVEASIAQVDLDQARTFIQDAESIRQLQETAVPALRSAAIRAGLLTVGCGLAGALLLSLVVYRKAWRRTAQVAGTVVGALVVTAGMAGITADPARLAQPRFTGLLTQAPIIAGQVPDVLNRLESYRAGLAQIVNRVTSLYAAVGRLPEDVNTGSDVTTVLHVSDIHLNPLAYDLMDKLVPQFGVDAVIDTGDIVTWRTDIEDSTLNRIRDLKVPYVYVRGNHDNARTAQLVARNPNAIVLEDRVVQVAGLTIAGIGDPEFAPDEDTPTGPVDTPSPSGPSDRPATPPPTPATSEAAPPVAAPADVETSPELRNDQQLANTIRTWNSGHPDAPVQIAAVHKPRGLDPLFGLVPTAMVGHLHRRQMRVDASGTRVMMEGSTGGAGISTAGIDSVRDGRPVPLSASLVYYANSGPRKGQIIAVDAITVGGFGLASVNLERTVISEQPALKLPGTQEIPATSTPSAPTPSPS